MKNNTKTHEIFVKEVESIVGSEYEVIGRYSTSHTKILMKHNKCGHTYSVTPGKFLMGRRCPECAKNKKKTTESFKRELFDLVGDEYSVLGEYINGDTEIKIKHNCCGHEFYIKPKNFLKTKKCPLCNPPKNKKCSSSEFKEKIYVMYGYEYSILGEYINNSTKILVKHNACGHEYYVRPANMLRGNKCPECFGVKKKNTEIFKGEVFNLVGDEYEVLDEYVNNNTKISIKHNTCGYQYSVRPSSFLKGSRCPNCFGTNKKDTKSFKQELFYLVENEDEVLGEYINSNTKILMRHNKCGHEYMVTPASILSGTRCPNCFGNKKKTNEQFIEEVYRNVKDEYSVLGEYINSNTKILMRHNSCGHEYMVEPRKFLSKRRCPKCAGNIKKTTEQFKEEVFSQVKDEYDVLGEYVTSGVKILMKHNVCNHEYLVRPSDFLNKKTRCPNCFGYLKKTTEQFKEEVFEQVGDEYNVLGEYIEANTKILMKHNVCNHEYLVTPSAFLNNKSRCPKCVGGVARSQEEFIEIFNKKFGNEYTLLSEYKNSSTPVLIKHNVCNHQYSTSPSNLTKEKYTKCPKCAGNIRKTTEQFKNEVFGLVGNEYEVLGKYINNGKKILVIHNKCGHEYEVRPGSFLKGARCPKCFGSLKKQRKNLEKKYSSWLGMNTKSWVNILIL